MVSFSAYCRARRTGCLRENTLGAAGLAVPEPFLGLGLGPTRVLCAVSVLMSLFKWFRAAVAVFHVLRTRSTATHVRINSPVDPPAKRTPTPRSCPLCTAPGQLVPTHRWCTNVIFVYCHHCCLVDNPFFLLGGACKTQLSPLFRCSIRLPYAHPARNAPPAARPRNPRLRAHPEDGDNSGCPGKRRSRKAGRGPVCQHAGLDCCYCYCCCCFGT